MKRNDIIIDSNYDFITYDGDFVIRNSDSQNVELILLTSPGTLRQYPDFGFGINNMINSKITPFLKFNLVKNLKNDGYNNTIITFSNDGNIEIKYNEYDQ